MRGRQDHPTREGLVQVSIDRAEIYRCRPPEELRVPLLVQPAAVNDDTPAEADIYMAVRRLKIGKEGGASGTRAENLKEWLREAKREKDPERRSWELVVRLLQVAFRDGNVP